ncbi:hypothetical protein M758_9G003000 [Ceratodon purpureus]|uniref:Uncharacterized protein n=1 Tax=Ceratodon purpureus TaxID=3225 RepID=A0A8T0GR32_CERPU|nr:hypothetical protein KC19_9G003300 [Ceratodon purpureus]KAG0604718.1 hypothetical protein M758_9G003000 [Ceratodon purpureus]
MRACQSQARLTSITKTAALARPKYNPGNELTSLRLSVIASLLMKIKAASGAGFAAETTVGFTMVVHTARISRKAKEKPFFGFCARVGARSGEHWINVPANWLRGRLQQMPQGRKILL